MATEQKERKASTPSGTFPQIVMEDLRRGDLKRTLRRDLKDVYHFYLTEESREHLRSKSRLKRWLLVVVWVAKSLYRNLPPVRRLLLLLSLALFLIGDIEFQADGYSFGLGLTGPAFLILLFILLLELKDKLLAKDELETGRAVQMSLLPKNIPQVAGWDIHYFSRPANDVGGDLVDYIRLREGGLALVLGDVAGKGLGAALLMAKLQATLRAIATEVHSLAELGARMNAIFYRDQVPGRFATLAYLMIGPDSGAVRLLNAGHLPPVKVGRKESTATEPVSPPIGLFLESTYQEQRLELGLGEALVVFSDGITEAQNPAGEFYGDERLLRLFSGLGPCTAREAVTRILGDVGRFVGDAAYADDLSLIVLRRPAPGETTSSPGSSSPASGPGAGHSRPESLS